MVIFSSLTKKSRVLVFLVLELGRNSVQNRRFFGLKSLFACAC